MKEIGSLKNPERYQKELEQKIISQSFENVQLTGEMCITLVGVWNSKQLITFPDLLK